MSEDNLAALLELSLCIATFAPFIPQTASYLSRKKTIARGYPYPSMVVHILSSLSLLARYYTALFRGSLSYRRSEVLLGLLFVLSAHSLEEARASRQSAFYRAGFRASYLMHGLVFLQAYRLNSLALYESGVKFLTWFASFRTAARLLMSFTPDLKKVSNYHRLNELTLISSIPLALWYAGLPVGWYVIGLFGMLVLDHTILRSENKSDPTHDQKIST